MPELDEHFEIIELIIPKNISNERLDRYLGRHGKSKISRSKIQKLIENGLVTVDGAPAAHNHKLQGGEKVIIKIPPPEKIDVVPEPIPLEVVYEDEHLLVVNKPAGMVTHPAAGHYQGTLVNALVHYTEKLSSAGGIERLGIVHRLDKDTSGLILIARHDEVHHALQKELKARRISRKYHALVCGHMKEDSGVIDLPIGRSLRDRKKMTVTGVRSREALTEYKLLDRFKLYDLLEINLRTGRTHQIRVHFSHIGHPVFGDPEYGGREKWHRGVISYDKLLAQKALKMLGRQALHARSLQFIHPVTGKQIALDSKLPDDFQRLLDFLKEEGR